MIAREWKARLPANQKEEFLSYLDKTGVQDSAATEGFKGAQVLVRHLSDQVEVTLITYWDNLEVIESFAGENIGMARLYPDDEKYQLEPNRFVSHYEVAASVWPQTVKA